MKEKHIKKPTPAGRWSLRDKHKMEIQQGPRAEQKFSCPEFIATQSPSGDPGLAEGLSKRASLEGRGGQRGSTDFLCLRRIFYSFYPEKKLALETLASYKMSEEGLNKSELCHSNLVK